MGDRVTIGGLAVIGSVDCVVVGAGVVGLACARALALAGREVLVLEAEPRAGEHASSRNSEVIHAGIYYPPGSRKAQLCVAGRRQLYAYLAERAIPHRRIGKLIVASRASRLPALRDLAERARRNGVMDLQWLQPAALSRLEPALAGVAGLWSPSTGIFDSHAFLRALEGDLAARGGEVALRAEVVGAVAQPGGFVVEVRQERAEYQLRCRALVNAAGLGALALARKMAEWSGDKVPPDRYARGRYMTYSGPVPFRRLIYPLPEPGGLGIHLTLDLAGEARFGPDVDWVGRPDYAFENAPREAFRAAIRQYWPGVEGGRLRPGYVGIRPKLSGPGQVSADFEIQGPVRHGIAGLVNLFGIESPGLTASLAIGDYVRDCLED